MPRYLFILPLLCSFATALCAAQTRNQEPPESRIDEVFAAWNNPESPGCAVAVLRDGKVVFKGGYGQANLDHDIAITTSTVFHVASISKQFTAAAVALLAAEGKLSLDDEVRKHIPELPEFGVPITLRHLIHHTSGLRDQWELLELSGWRYSRDRITDEDVLEVVSRQRRLNFQPGNEYLYSNTGYTLLAMTVSRVSGKSFREFTRERFFAPLGMAQTNFRDDHGEIIKQQAYGYTSRAEDTFRLSATNFDTVGATSLLTTVEDLARWDRNFYDATVGGREWVRGLEQPGILNSGASSQYAFGLVLGTYRGLRTVSHAGSDAGYRSHYGRFPDHRLSIICLCNASTAWPGRLAEKVADIYLADAFTVEAYRVFQPEPSRLASRAGLYWSKTGDAFREFAVREGKLHLVFPGQEFELIPIAEGHFEVAAFPLQFRFASEKGRTRLLEIPQLGATQTYETLQPYTPATDSLHDYTGLYRSDEIDVPYRFEVSDNALIMSRLKSRNMKLRPVMRDVFVGPAGTIRFIRSREGHVESMVLTGGRVRKVEFAKQRAEGQPTSCASE